MAFLSNSRWQNYIERPNRSNKDMADTVKHYFVCKCVSEGVSEEFVTPLLEKS